MSITIARTWQVDGVYTNVTSAKLSDAAGLYGVKRLDSGAVVVPDGTDMAHVGTGHYSYTFEEPAAGLSYTAAIEIVYEGLTYRFDEDFEGIVAALGILDADDVLLELGLSAAATDEEQRIVNSAIKRAEAAVRRYLHYDPRRQEHTEYLPGRDYSGARREYVWESSQTHAYMRELGQAAMCELQLRHLPVRSVGSLRVDYDGRGGTRSGAFAADTAKAEGVDFWPNYDGTDSAGRRICRDGILRSEGSWPSAPGCIRVVYTAGYTQDELEGNDTEIDATPIWEACLDEAVRRARRALVMKKGHGGHVAGPFTSERLGDYSYSLDGGTVKQVASWDADLMPSSREKLESFVNWGWS